MSDLFVASSDDQPLGEPDQPLLPRRWDIARIIRWAAALVYTAALAVSIHNVGLPLDRERLALWLVVALAITGIGRSPREALFLVRDWSLLVVVFLAYDFSRGLADRLGIPVHVMPMIRGDQALFFGRVPSVWLQEHLVTPGVVRWWDVVVALTYASHFVAAYVLAAVLWARDHPAFKRFVARFVAVSFLGVATFALFPAAPPWMASRQGVIGPVDRIVNRGWSEPGLRAAERLIDKGQATVNLVAAVPSLHAAFALLVSVTLWRRLPSWWRPVLVAYPLLMAFTIVYGGEHDVVDVLWGWAYVALACWGCTRIEGRLARRRVVRA
jgi:hypothetical protein